jgi:NAD(P)-dependent dehydrogenase (short-subunit alcohol dehydrogenase family)
MKIEGSVGLVTGADRGLGRVFARDLVRRGAARVFGAARHPEAVTEPEPGVTPLALDITDPELVARIAEQCPDVSLLVNNAGVMTASTFMHAPNLDAARLEMDTNYLAHQGTLVVAVHASFIDTEMAAGIDVPKISPESVAQQTFDAVEAGQVEVLADDRSRFVKASPGRDHELLYPDVQAFRDKLLGGPPG